MENRATIRELADWLRTHEDFVLLGHVNPDGDSAGSCMALCLALRALGKRAFVCLPGGAIRMYARYPGDADILPPDGPLPFAPKTAFAVDVSELPRLGAGRELFESCPSKAMLDHHATNPGFGDLWHVDGSRAAAGELALELIEALDVKLDRDMATWLFIALSTDSGHFRFSSTTPVTMQAGAKLLETGVDIARITRELWYTRTRARTQLMGMVLAELEVSEDGLMAWGRLTNDMRARACAGPEDSEGIINYLLEIEGVEFAALAEERENGTKFSLRAKEWLNVAEQVAKPFGGGGHAFAAGCSLPMPLEEALAKVLAQARVALDNR